MVNKVSRDSNPRKVKKFSLAPKALVAPVFFVSEREISNSMSWEGVRGERFKYARYIDQDPAYEYLHDLKNDPDELTNLANDPDYASLLKRLRRRTDVLAEGYANALKAASSPSAKRSQP